MPQETPKYETPRRGCWVTATPSPNQTYSYQNPLSDEAELGQYDSHVPPLPQFSVPSHGPAAGFSSEGGDGNPAMDAMQAEAQQQFLFQSFSAQNFQFPQQPQQCAFQGPGKEFQPQDFQQQDLEGQAGGTIHPLAYYPPSQGCIE
jgi:hypothetical protein